MTDRARELVEQLRRPLVIEYAVPLPVAETLQLAANERAEAADFIEQSLTLPEGDTVSEGVVELVRDYVYDCTADEFGHGWTLSAEQTAHVIRLAALQSRVSPQEGMREALEEARRALRPFAASIIFHPEKKRGDRHWATYGSQTNTDQVMCAQDAIAKIDAALSTAPIPMSEDVK